MPSGAAQSVHVMKTKFVIILAALAAFILGTTAPAQDPPSSTGTTVVVPEPPGDNCPDGGVKIIFTPTPEPDPTPDPTEEPTPDPTEEPTPDPTVEPTPDPTETPDPEPTPLARASQADEPEITYVCNGQQGEPGLEGLPGMDGQDALDGLEPDGDLSEGPLAARTDRACSSARVARLRLPSRFNHVRRVKLTVNGKRKRVRVNVRRVIKVDLRKAPCGYYPVLVQRRGVKSALYVWRLTSFGIVRHPVL